MEFLPPPALRGSDAEFVRQSYHIKVPAGGTVADLMRPAFWAHHAAKFQPDAIIDAVAEDGSFDVTIRVVAVDDRKTSATMRLLRHWEPPVSNLVLADDAPLYVNHTPKTGWRVIRRADGAELVRNIVQKADAIKWALDTMRLAA